MIIIIDDVMLQVSEQLCQCWESEQSGQQERGPGGQAQECAEGREDRQELRGRGVEDGLHRLRGEGHQLGGPGQSVQGNLSANLILVHHLLSIYRILARLRD